MHTLVVYDIESDKIRNRVITACKDYGLSRIQFSAFLGEIGHNRRQELEKRIRKILGKNRGKVNFFPICDKDFGLMKEIVVGEMKY
ncbi:MAG TPA: CRISPR-associated endonuclease Cas2 [Candidatus Latescibacteria bacterium]|nr:CRISPR-associated endonuclease Cas2 [Candidatus Latescibacterota bacterium]